MIRDSNIEESEEDKKQREIILAARVLSEEENKSTSIFGNPFAGKSSKKKKKRLEKEKEKEKAMQEMKKLSLNDAVSPKESNKKGTTSISKKDNTGEIVAGAGGLVSETKNDGGGESKNGEMKDDNDDDEVSSDEEEAPPPIPPPTDLLDLYKVTRDAIPYYRRFKYRKVMLDAITIRAGLKGKKRRPPAPRARWIIYSHLYTYIQQIPSALPSLT